MQLSMEKYDPGVIKCDDIFVSLFHILDIN